MRFFALRVVPAVLLALAAGCTGPVPVGRFLVTVSRSSGAPSIRVAHASDPSRALMESVPGESFLTVARATATVHESRGSFTITDQVHDVADRASVATIESRAGTLVLRGEVGSAREKVGYRLALVPATDDTLRLEVRLEGPNASRWNRTRLRFASTPDERFFGFGAQLTRCDQKGRLVRVLSQEPGVGRGRPILTPLVNLLSPGSAGTDDSASMAAPHFVTSKLRSFYLEDHEYSVFDLRRPDRVEVELHSSSMTATLVHGRTPLDHVAAYTAFSGRMRALPDWVHSGAIVGVQGGSDVALRALDRLEREQVPLAALWLQDWCGQRKTSAGQQLWWNWKLDLGLYPRWRDVASRSARLGARVLAYANPFLVDAPGHDELYREAKARGYLVRDRSGKPYEIANTDFHAGLVDLSHPGARAWMKAVLKERLVKEAGASGWMADFGEALPFDAVLASGESAASWHNRYPVEWAKLNREVLEEAGLARDGLTFHRSGFARSPGSATLFWLGDQCTTWDEQDGIKSAVNGMLSGGFSGFSLLHSDTGGYTSIRIPHVGIPVLVREKELLLRWMELSAFTPVLRTHEGLTPKENAQWDTDPDTVAHLRRFSRVYRALAFYRRELVAEAARTGAPVTRHPFLQHPEDPESLGLRYQYFLGSELLVAPVLDKKRSTVRVRFPAGTWVNVWTDEEVQGPAWRDVAAPLGRPAVFHPKGSSVGQRFVAALRAEGLR